jgi:hypothetical protein
MKRLSLILYIIFWISIPSKSSTSIPLDSIKMSLISFLKEIDQIKDFPIEDLPDFLIYDRRRQEAIKEGKEGIFIFSSNLASGIRHHFLLVEQDSFEILNMAEPITQNTLKLIDFFNRNKQYYREDILFYIGDLIFVYQRNEEHIKSFNGIIK